MSRVFFSVTALGVDLRVPQYAVPQEHESQISAICRSLQQQNRRVRLSKPVLSDSTRTTLCYQLDVLKPASRPLEYDVLGQLHVYLPR